MTTTVAAAVLALGALAAPALAQNVGDVGVDNTGNVWTFVRQTDGTTRWVRGRIGTGGTERTILAERYTPTIWTDPDGCEHWVMDDGAEGYMTPHLLPGGTPVCNTPMMMAPGD
jgi:hypothetical protein